MRKIALEEHWFHPLNTDIRIEFNERTQSTSFRNPEFFSPSLPRMLTEGIEEYRLKEMDENGIDVQILSHQYPGIQGILSADEAISKAKIINDDMAEITRKYPTRFKGFATLPMQAPEAAADELERTVKDLGFVGALINGHTNGEFLDEDKFRIVWERSVALKAPIYLHAFDPIPDQVKVYKGYRQLIGPSWSWNTDTATHVMRIISSGLFEELPEATLIVGHMGEFLPYMLARIDEGYEQTGGHKSWKIPREPSYYYRNNVMITTSGKWNPETLVCAISALGADRVMFSVDYPFLDSSISVSQVENTPMSQDDKEKIYHGNAERLFML